MKIRALYTAYMMVLIPFGGMHLQSSDLSDSILKIKQVGQEGQGNESAMEAWRDLSNSKITDLPEIIKGLNNASPMAGNWIRLASDVIVSRAQDSGNSEGFPSDSLTLLVMDKANSPEARELAYRVLSEIDSDYANKMVGLFLDDPSLPLRRLAIGQEIDKAQILKTAQQIDSAKTLFSSTLSKARDIDQIESIITELNGLGENVTVAETFGFLNDWHVIGPFHNDGRMGFMEEFAPEVDPDLKKTHTGKNGKVKWKKFTSKNPYGKFDFNEAIGPVKKVTAYASRQFIVDSDLDVQLRLGCKNAWKIWLNGKYIFGRDEYHRGSRIDQYSFPVKLKKGANHILLKICQNEQMETWTREWEFQFRITDSLGKPISESKN